LIAADVPGSDSTFQNLGSVGLSFNKDGTLTLDSTKLGAALASDPSGVQKLFVKDPTSGSTGIMGTISSAINTLTTGSGSLIQAEVTSFTNRVTNLTKSQANLQAQVATYQATLQAQFSSMESTVQSNKTDFFNLGGTGTFV
jgi:flagellar hook-associated protein 2